MQRERRARERAGLRPTLFRLWFAAGLFAVGLGTAAAESPVTFQTVGGEAWTFEKPIAGSVRDGACDSVTLTSPADSVTATVENDRFAARLRLQPGANDVRAECRRGGAANGEHTWQTWHVRLRDQPKAWIEAQVADTEIVLDGSGTELAPARDAPIVAYEWRERPGNPAGIHGLPAAGARLTIPAPQTDGEYYVTLRATDLLGRSDESTVMLRVRDGRTQPPDAQRDAPAWVDRAVVYGVEPRLFGPRGLDDVTARLDDLAALGVSVLWLLPITSSPSGDFGYAVTDHFRVRAEFGSESDLRELVDAAHARGLRVIMDFVPNHLSDKHAYFVDAAAQDVRSPYFDFFARTPEGAVATYFNWDNLKNLNYDHPEVQRFMIEAFAYWVREFDIDGFRVDVAWGPRERRPEFWPRWRAELKRIKPDLLLLAEASARDPYYATHGFDAAYDWTETLGHWAWREAFETEDETARRLGAAVAATAATSSTRVLRFLNNNDTGPRFISRYGLERTRVAAAMLLTLPGLPALYTGDAIGAEFEPYGAKAPLTWEDTHRLRAWYRHLLILRSKVAALRASDIQIADTSPGENVLAYLRPDALAPRNSVLVLLNYGREPVQTTVSGSAFSMFAAAEVIYDLLTDEALRIDVQAPRISVPPYGARILSTQRSSLAGR